MFRNLRQLLSYYRGFASKLHVFIRWFIFPFDKLEKNLPISGHIVDIGCGEGAFSIYSAISSKKRVVSGVDIDARRIAIARKAGKIINNATFYKKNALSWKRKVNGIVISDVFHHLSLNDQYKFLKQSYNNLQKGGVLVIKEINKDDTIRSRLSRLWDFILYPGDKINYWSRSKLISKLNKQGFKVNSFREAPFFPGSTFFYICTKLK